MINYLSSTNMIIIAGIILTVCLIGYYLGSMAINKIPNDNCRLRLLKAVQYATFMLTLLFILLMKFQMLPFLSAPDEFTTSKSIEMRHFQNIESLKTSLFSSYYAGLFWIFTSFQLIVKALKQ